MPEIRLREPLAGIVASIADKFNGDYSAPGAITLGPVTIYLVVPDDALRRHEAVHRAQAERFRPWWARGPLAPLGRGISFTRFTAYYLAEHRRVGYEASKFEVEARAAE